MRTAGSRIRQERCIEWSDFRPSLAEIAPLVHSDTMTESCLRLAHLETGSRANNSNRGSICNNSEVLIRQLVISAECPKLGGLAIFDYQQQTERI